MYSVKLSFLQIKIFCRYFSLQRYSLVDSELNCNFMHPIIESRLSHPQLPAAWVAFGGLDPGVIDFTL